MILHCRPGRIVLRLAIFIVKTSLLTPSAWNGSEMETDCTSRSLFCGAPILISRWISETRKPGNAHEFVAEADRLETLHNSRLRRQRW